MKARPFLILTCLLALCGCQKNVPADNPARLEPKEFQRQLQETVRTNPDLVLNVLRDNKVEVLTIVEQGVGEKRKLEERKRLDRELEAPLKTEVSLDRPYLGASNAPVTIVAYSDFLCPYCKRGAQTISSLLKEHPGRIKYAFKHYVRDEFSAKLARVFEAIALQDTSKAWQFYTDVFDNQSALVAEKDQKLDELLGTLNLDMDRLAEDMETAEIKQYIEKDTGEAETFGFRGTPSFVINGVSLRGAYPKEKFEEIMDMVAPKK